MDFVEGADTPRNLTTWLDRRPRFRGFHADEVRAYSLLASAQYRDAASALGRLIEQIDSSVDWEAKTGTRAKRFLRLAEENKHAEVQASLHDVETSVRKLLKLPSE